MTALLIVLLVLLPVLVAALLVFLYGALVASKRGDREWR